MTLRHLHSELEKGIQTLHTQQNKVRPLREVSIQNVSRQALALDRHESVYSPDMKCFLTVTQGSEAIKKTDMFNYRNQRKIQLKCTRKKSTMKPLRRHFPREAQKSVTAAEARKRHSAC